MLAAKGIACKPYCALLWECFGLSQFITLWFSSTFQVLTVVQWTQNSELEQFVGVLTSFNELQWDKITLQVIDML